MITELEISGYKALKQVTIKGLRRLTLLGGRNNTGKTSVLEAFFLSRDWGHPEQLTRHLKWRGLEAFVTDSQSSWAPAFTNFDLKNSKIHVRARDAQGDRTVFSLQVLDAPTRPAQPSIASSTATAQNVRAPGEPSLRLTFMDGTRTVFEAQVHIAQGVPPYVMTPIRLEAKAQPVSFVLARQRTPATEDAANFGKLDTEKRANEILELLQIIEPKLNGLSVVPVGPASQIYADVSDVPRKIPVNLMGDGITRLLSMLLHIANVPGGFLLVDEIENAFHHSAMPSIWQALYKMCKTHKCQLIATTHSYECVSAFASSLKETAGDEFAYIRLDKKDGAIEAVTYDAKALENATEGGWEVR
jgi:hypothetical protein